MKAKHLSKYLEFESKKRSIEEEKGESNIFNIKYVRGGAKLRKYGGFSLTDMTPTMCNKMCLKMNYTYFGIQFGYYCFCSNTPPNPKKKFDMTKCDTFCPGNSLIRCGGRARMNAWPVCQKKECNFTE